MASRPGQPEVVAIMEYLHEGRNETLVLAVVPSEEGSEDSFTQLPEEFRPFKVVNINGVRYTAPTGSVWDGVAPDTDTFPPWKVDASVHDLPLLFIGNKRRSSRWHGRYFLTEKYLFIEFSARRGTGRQWFKRTSATTWTTVFPLRGNTHAHLKFLTLVTLPKVRLALEQAYRIGVKVT